jgi:alpha-L-fucosidase
VQIVEGVADWMDVNRECIFDTQPWKVFGEGPASAGAKLRAQGFNEGKGKPFTAEDFRFTTGSNTLYAIELGWPTNGVSVKSLGKSAKLLDGKIRKIELLGSKEKVKWKRTDEALVITQPKNEPNNFAVVYKITLR